MKIEGGAVLLDSKEKKKTLNYEMEELYFKYYADVYRYVCLLNFNTSYSEDIVQNTFEKALRGLAGFRGDSSVKTWLYTIARNESIRFSQKHPQNTSLSEIDLMDMNVYIEDSICTKETAKEVLLFIAKLEEPKRSLLVLRLLQEKRFIDIGKIIDKSDTWCRVTFMREKNKLLKQLEGEVGNDEIRV